MAQGLPGDAGGLRTRLNKPKFSDKDYIDFLIASPRTFSCTEAARVQPEQNKAPAHGAITRLLYRLRADPDQPWQEARTQVTLAQGILVIDDSTVDKPYACRMELVHRQWSGKHRRVVCGIDLVSLLCTDDDRHVPVDWRVYDQPHDPASKNDHFSSMIQSAKAQGAGRSYIGLTLRAFLRLESLCFHTGISWFAAKTQIIHDAVRVYSARPQCHLMQTA